MTGLSVRDGYHITIFWFQTGIYQEEIFNHAKKDVILDLIEFCFVLSSKEGKDKTSSKIIFALYCAIYILLLSHSPWLRSLLFTKEYIVIHPTTSFCNVWYDGLYQYSFFNKYTRSSYDCNVIVFFSLTINACTLVSSGFCSCHSIWRFGI